MGATKGAESKELEELFDLITKAPQEALDLLELTVPENRQELLLAIFPWMATLLSRLEQGGDI